MNGHEQSAQGISGRYSQSIDQLFQKYDKYGSPGAMLAVVYQGEVIHQRGYGVANLENDIAFNDKTVLRLGSTSKHLCATCLLILRSRNLLDLDEDIRKYLPELPEFEWPVTIHHLLTMTSGIKDGLNMLLFVGLGVESPVTQNQLIEFLNLDPQLMFAPGSGCSYSNTNYALLSEIVVRVSGKSLGEFMHKELFAPLGMQDTELTPSTLKTDKNLAHGYLPLLDGGYSEGVMGIELSGDGGVSSTLHDMLLWLKNYQDDQLLDGKLREQLEVENHLLDSQLNSYRCGITVTQFCGESKISHAGGMPGFLCDFVYYPVSDLGIVLLTNLLDVDLLDTPDKISEIILQPSIDKAHIQTASLPRGCYANLDLGLVIEIAEEERRAILYFLGEKHPLVETTQGVYQSTKTASPYLLKTSPANEAVQLKIGAASYADFQLVEVLTGTPLDKYTGTYDNHALNEQHIVHLQDDSLIVELASPFRTLVWRKFKHVAGDLFTSDIEDEPSCTNVQILFLRKEHQISGFQYNVSRCLGVKFDRVDQGDITK